MPITNLTNADLQILLEKEPDLLLLDVRTPEEYFLLGHIPGARLLPIHQLPEQAGTLDPQQRTVVICEHGIRSQDAAHYLARLNFTRIAHLAAGMAEWNGPRAYASQSTPLDIRQQTKEHQALPKSPPLDIEILEQNKD